MATLKNQHVFVGVDTQKLFGKKKYVLKEKSLKKKYGTDEIEGMRVKMMCMADGLDYGLSSKGEKIENLVGSDVEVIVEQYSNLVDLKFMDEIYPNPNDVIKTSVYRPNGAFRDEVSIKMKKISHIPSQPASQRTEQKR